MSKFKKVFHTERATVTGINGEDINRENLNGKQFIVITEKDPTTYAYEEAGTMYIIEFDGGLVVEAFEEEVLI